MRRNILELVPPRSEKMLGRALKTRTWYILGFSLKSLEHPRPFSRWDSLSGINQDQKKTMNNHALILVRAMHHLT